MTISLSEKRSPKMGRPTSEESRKLDEIVKSKALELFMELGYDGVSMDVIAKASGITKRTLYARYKDKRTLFAKALGWAKTEWSEPEVTRAANNTATLEEKLIAVGDALIAQVLVPASIKLSRIAASKADDFPVEVQKAFDTTLSPRIKTISRILEHHQLAGEIETEDSKVAAELFIGLITGIPARLAIFGVFRDAAIEKSRICYAVKLFIKGILKRPLDKDG